MRKERGEDELPILEPAPDPREPGEGAGKKLATCIGANYETHFASAEDMWEAKG